MSDSTLRLISLQLSPANRTKFYPFIRFCGFTLCIAKGFSAKDSKIAHRGSSLGPDFYSFYQNNIPFQPQDNSVFICKNSQIKPRKSEQV